MAIRILGGVLKGMEITAPPASETRPTAVLLRRRLFDAFQQWQNTWFIDCCAGSGAMGLEAASRGAEGIIFIEDHPKVLPILRKNITKAQQLLQQHYQTTTINLLQAKAENEINCKLLPPKLIV